MTTNPILRALALDAAPCVVDFTIHYYSSGAGPDALRSLARARTVRDQLADVAARFERATDAIQFCERQAEFHNDTESRADVRYGCQEAARRIRAAFGLTDGAVSAPDAA